MTIEQFMPWADIIFPALCAMFCYVIKSAIFRQLSPLITEMKLHRQILDQQHEAMARLTKTLDKLWKQMDDTRDRLARVEVRVGKDG